jgi:hypothetical protein
MPEPMNHSLWHQARAVERRTAAGAAAVLLCVLVVSHWRGYRREWHWGEAHVWRGGVLIIDSQIPQRALIERFRNVGDRCLWWRCKLGSPCTAVAFPLWPLVVIAGWRGWGMWRRGEDIGAEACAGCGYDRRGIGERACPECGRR